MNCPMKPLPIDPDTLTNLSERLILSHYENNYGGAVKRLNAITEQLRSLDYATAPVFVINGLKREELIASNSTSCTRSILRGWADKEGCPRGLFWMP
jgi:superoxide dismutase, Fe-Mn family